MGVPVEELRPDSGYTRFILAAVYDIRLCEVMFDGWMTQLNRCAMRSASLLQHRGLSHDDYGDHRITINSNRPNERERLLEFYLGLLREGAGECSKSTNAILQCHVQFANLMARRMEDASKSRLRALNRDELGTTTLADDINKASQELLLYVTRMKDNLSSFVSDLEKIEITVGKEQTFTVAEWIWGWLKSLFIMIAWIFATPGTFIIRTAPAHSPLRREATKFCGAAQALGAFLEHTIPCEEEVMDSWRKRERV